jgi:hypothetical protein
MNTMETSQKTVEDLAALQTKSVDLHAAYFSTASKHLAEDIAEIAEFGRSYLEALAKAETFSAAFQVGVEFEDNAKERLKDIVEVNATALKGLGDELASLYKLSPVADETVKPAAKKTPAKAKAKAATTA